MTRLSISICLVCGLQRMVESHKAYSTADFTLFQRLALSKGALRVTMRNGYFEAQG